MQLNPMLHAYKSFQLFGFDFMVDADFKAFLIEVARYLLSLYNAVRVTSFMCA